MESEKLVYSVEELTELLGVSRPTAYRVVERPDFPSFRFNGRWLIYRDGLRAWIEKQIAKKSEG